MNELTKKDKSELLDYIIELEELASNFEDGQPTANKFIMSAVKKLAKSD